MNVRRVIGVNVAVIIAFAAATGIARWYAAPEKPPAPAAQGRPPISTEPLTPEEKRDRERYRNMTSLRIALDSFRNRNKRYPAKLEELVPAFLDAAPADPSTQAPYQYRPGSDAFTVSFSLEVGAFALSKGDHILTNRGFDLPVEPLAPAPPAPAAEEQTFADADADGLADADEAEIDSDPRNPDTDGDGLNDGEEENVERTDPLKADTDGDGFNDGQEVQAGFDPLGPGRR